MGIRRAVASALAPGRAMRDAPVSGGEGGHAVSSPLRVGVWAL